jgi:OTU domain-containing protein 6
MGNGSKRQKLKKVLSPVSGRSSNATSPPPADEEDEDLMDQLMAELDSKDQATQAEAATVLNEITETRSHDNSPTAIPTNDSKARYKARQVRLMSVDQDMP